MIYKTLHRKVKKTEVNSGAPEKGGGAVPAPLVAPIMLLLLQMNVTNEERTEMAVQHKKRIFLALFFNQDNNDSLRANLLARSPGQVKLDLDK